LDRAGKPFFAHEQVDFVVGAPGRAPDGPAWFCGETIGPPAGILFPPMLFAPNALASGPQARFSAEEKGTKVKGGKHIGRLPKKFFVVQECHSRPSRNLGQPFMQDPLPASLVFSFITSES